VVKAVLDEQAKSRPATNGDGPTGLPERLAAERLGVPFYVLRDARKRGQIHAMQLGRTWVYSPESLERFLKGERVSEAKQKRRGKR
jgi:hypothetical protein